jgi:hypothetical protein
MMLFAIFDRVITGERASAKPRHADGGLRSQAGSASSGFDFHWSRP